MTADNGDPKGHEPGPEQHADGGPGVPPPPPPPPGFPGPFFAYGPPPAPKPGVIPLRPLDVGEILGGLFATIRRYWRPLYGLTLALLGGAFLICAAVAAAGAATVWGPVEDLFLNDGPQHAVGGHLPALIATGTAVAAVWLLVLLYATAALHAVCTVVVSHAVTGSPATAGQVWREARPRVLPVAGVQLLTGLLLGALILVGYALAVGLVVLSLAGSLNGEGPGAAGIVGILVAVVLALAFLGSGVLLAVRFGLAPAAAVLEGAPAGTAMRRSWRLVRGSWWRVFGITLLVGLIVAMIGQILQYAALLVGLGGAAVLQPSEEDIGPVVAAVGLGGVLGVSVLLSVLTEPFARLTLALLYVDLRIRNESLDLALATSAGLPPHRPA